MGLSLRAGGGREDAVTSEINTTPLVDVMLVLLIIFLITIPVVRQTVPLELPRERNTLRQTAPENIEISVDSAGALYWNGQALAGHDQLLQRLKAASVRQPQPSVQVRGDIKARYESVGRVLLACQRAAIAKVGFVTDPAIKG